MKKSEFKTGEFLYEIQSDEQSVIAPEDDWARTGWHDLGKINNPAAAFRL